MERMPEDVGKQISTGRERTAFVMACSWKSNVIRGAVVVVLTFAATGVVAFTIVRNPVMAFGITTSIVALCFHSLYHRYVLAAILSACTTTGVFRVYYCLGFGDFLLASIAATLALGFLVALVVGLPFLFFRRILPPRTHCQNCGLAPIELVWGVCPSCGELLDAP